MHLQLAVQNVFGQMRTVFEQLTSEQYAQPCENLSGATIGQHTRHILEMYQCLLTGIDGGIVNYENRQRDIRIECDMDFATALMDSIEQSIQRPNLPLQLHAGFDTDSHEQVNLETNLWREIAYNLEHTIHHMALIKVALLDCVEVIVPEGFGVASSTIKYKKACAQ